MAPPDKKRQGSEKGQGEHPGRTSEASDAGMQTHSQGARGEGPVESDDTGASDTQRGLVSPVERSDADGPVADRGMEQSGDTRAGEARTTDAEARGSRR